MAFWLYLSGPTPAIELLRRLLFHPSGKMTTQVIGRLAIKGNELDVHTRALTLCPIYLDCLLTRLFQRVAVDAGTNCRNATLVQPFSNGGRSFDSGNLKGFPAPVWSDPRSEAVHNLMM